MEHDSGAEAKLVREFEIPAERAGLVIPPERRDGVFGQFRVAAAYEREARDPVRRPALATVSG